MILSDIWRVRVLNFFFWMKVFEFNKGWVKVKCGKDVFEIRIRYIIVVLGRGGVDWFYDVV